MIKFRAHRWKEEELAKRLCRLFYGNDYAERYPGESRWHIGRANDVWLHPEGDEVYHLNYRYWTPEKMTALATVLDWFLGVEILEIT